MTDGPVQTQHVFIIMAGADFSIPRSRQPTLKNKNLSHQRIHLGGGEFSRKRNLDIEGGKLWIMFELGAAYTLNG